MQNFFKTLNTVAELAAVLVSVGVCLGFGFTIGARLAAYYLGGQ
jgi:hypothetical protein